MAGRLIAVETATLPVLCAQTSSGADIELLRHCTEVEENSKFIWRSTETHVFQRQKL